MSDDVIDLGEYARRRDRDGAERTTFAVWGGEGERSRFALPLWRAVFLAGGNRGALVSTAAEGAALEPLVILDLVHDPARVDFPERILGPGDLAEASPAPHLREREDATVVYLGEHRDRRWFLVIDGVAERQDPLERRTREDILFLAGECAGLLFFRELADDAGTPARRDPSPPATDADPDPAPGPEHRD